MMQILSVAIYSKSGAIERWDLRTGAVNIVTGSRRTGKTALLQIVEYCLGKGECEISPGSVVRNYVEWYALLLQIDQTQALIARRNPPRGAGTSSEIYLEIGSDLKLPALVDLRRTVDIDGLIATMADLVGITDNVFVPRKGQPANLWKRISNTLGLIYSKDKTRWPHPLSFFIAKKRTPSCNKPLRTPFLSSWAL